MSMVMPLPEDQVAIGGNDRYRLICRQHYKEALGGNGIMGLFCFL